MVSTQQIQYILQLSETKNFSKAADACFVTQPTLSMQIKKAEDVLGFLIFDRNKNPLELTHMGRQLMPIIQEINQCNNAVLQLSKKASGTYVEELNIGIIPTISAYLIPMLYQKWKRELTHTRLIIKENKTEDILELLENKKIDFAIIAGPSPDAKWKTFDLYTEELFAYTQNKNAGIIKTNDLSDQKPWLLSQGNCLRSQMMQFCKLNVSLEEDWNFEGGNMELLIKMVDMNGGYTLVPNHYKTLLNKVKGSFHSIKDSKTNASPARSIIGLQSNRNSKNDSIQKIVQSVQLLLNKSSKKDFSIINWK
jgi:LysR family transcriptional regulator, hydrogen peroxide-inducible genes activator